MFCIIEREYDLRQPILKRRSRTEGSATEAPSFESRSLAKGLQILEILRTAPEAMPLKDVAAAVGLAKASTLRLLRTLQATGYIARDSHDAYHIVRTAGRSEAAEEAERIRSAARPLLAQLNVQFGETVSMAYLFGDLIRVVDVVESTHNIRMSNYVGRILQPYASAMGKAISAFQPADRIQSLLDTYGIYSLTPATLTDVRAIRQDLAEVRERGYSRDCEETVPGGQCIGAPVTDSTGQVVAAISVSTPKFRFTPELERILPEVVTQAAAGISAALNSPFKR